MYLQVSAIKVPNDDRQYSRLGDTFCQAGCVSGIEAPNVDSLSSRNATAVTDVIADLS